MPKLTEERHNAIGRLQAGANQGDFARYMGVCRATINRLWVRYTNTESTRDRPRSGRPKETTPSPPKKINTSMIQLIHLRDRFRTATSTPNRYQSSTSGWSCVDLCDTTFSCHIISQNDFGGVKNTFTGHMHSGGVLFFNESRFTLVRADGRSRIYRRHKESYAASCVQEHDRFGGGSVIVRAGIHRDGRTAVERVNRALSVHV